MKKILIIEDHTWTTQLFKDILLNWRQLEIIDAEDGDTGMQKAVNDKPDLILLDIMLRARTDWRYSRN